MNIHAVGLLFLASLIASIFIIAADRKIQIAIAGIVFLDVFLFLWILCAGLLPPEIDREEILPILTFKSNETTNIQYVLFEDEHGLKTVNLNEHFKRNIPENCKCKRTIYHKWYYLGISYSEFKGACKDSFKVVDEKGEEK